MRYFGESALGPGLAGGKPAAMTAGTMICRGNYGGPWVENIFAGPVATGARLVMLRLVAIAAKVRKIL